MFKCALTPALGTSPLNPFRTTYATAHAEVTLGYSSKDLQAIMDSGFSQIIGVFKNFTVATGQDTDAWVDSNCRTVARGCKILLEDAKGYSRSLDAYLQELASFLDRHPDAQLKIRHHYAWWYPKWLDMLRASL